MRKNPLWKLISRSICAATSGCRGPTREKRCLNAWTYSACCDWLSRSDWTSFCLSSPGFPLCWATTCGVFCYRTPRTVAATSAWAQCRRTLPVITDSGGCSNRSWWMTRSSPFGLHHIPVPTALGTGTAVERGRTGRRPQLCEDARTGRQLECRHVG